MSAAKARPLGGQGLRQGRSGARMSLRDLRRASAADVPAITRMQQAAYAPNRVILGREPLPLLVDYADVVAQKEVFLAEEDKTIVGVLVLEPRASELYVENVSVAPQAQGTGLGNDLLAAAEERARDLGLSRLSLITGERLTRNVAWYQRHGYAIERIEDRDGRGVVHMQKSL